MPLYSDTLELAGPTICSSHITKMLVCCVVILGANIFLTSDGPLKLGDFGSAVKLKNHTTMPGEVNNLVGTAGEFPASHGLLRGGNCLSCNDTPWSSSLG